MQVLMVGSSRGLPCKLRSASSARYLTVTREGDSLVLRCVCVCVCVCVCPVVFICFVLQDAAERTCGDICTPMSVYICVCIFTQAHTYIYTHSTELHGDDQIPGQMC